MKVKVAKKVVAGKAVNGWVEEYNSLRAEAKRIKERMDTLANSIKDYAKSNGVKDDKGSFYCDSHPDFIFGASAKKSVSFDETKALQYLKDKGFNDAIVTIEKIDEGVVERYINEDAISFEDLESITKTRVTYAIDVKAKADMSEVEETTVQIAASKKKAGSK